MKLGKPTTTRKTIQATTATTAIAITSSAAEVSIWYPNQSIEMWPGCSTR